MVFSTELHLSRYIDTKNGIYDSSVFICKKENDIAVSIVKS